MRFTFILVFLVTVAACFAQWSDNPAVNNAIDTQTGEQAVAKVAHCPDGGMYIGWYSNATGNYNVRLQYLTFDGTPQWGDSGILVSSHEQNSWITDWSLITDNEGNAILGFQDLRSGDGLNAVAYKILPDGTFAWGADGVMLSDDGADNYIPRLAVTDANNIIVAWMATTDVKVQKISPAGTLLLDTPLILSNASVSHTYPQPMGVSGDAFILKYYEDSGPAWAPTRHVFAQKYDTNVDPVWTSPAAISTQGGISAWTQWLDIVSDGADGMWTGWYDDRDSNNLVESYVAHVAADGTVTFGDGGVSLTNENTMQNYMPSLSKAPNGVYAFWRQTDANQNNSALKGQLVETDGLHWSDSGGTYVSISSRVVAPIAAAHYNSDAIVIYSDDAPTGTTDNTIKAMRIDETGALVWTNNPADVSTCQSSKLHHYAVDCEGSQWVAVWDDERNGSSDIYAQNINYDGTIGVAAAPSGISGTVTLNGGAGDVTFVNITVEGGIYYPNADGDYSITLEPGTYDMMFQLGNYTNYEATDVVVEEGEFTTVNVTLDYITVQGVEGTVTLDGGSGDVSAVAITIDGEVYHPDANGGYSVVLEVGTYSVLFELDDYYDVEVTDVVVEADAFTTVDVTMEYIVAAGEDTPPLELNLAARPNPFNPETSIAYAVTQPGHVRLDVYDVRGRKVTTLVNQRREAGRYSVVWRANGVASGVYFARLTTAGGQRMLKLALLK